MRVSVLSWRFLKYPVLSSMHPWRPISPLQRKSLDFFLKPNTWVRCCTCWPLRLFKYKRIHSSISGHMSKNTISWIWWALIRDFSFKVSASSHLLLYWSHTSCTILRRSDNGKLQNFDGRTDGQTIPNI